MGAIRSEAPALAPPKPPTQPLPPAGYNKKKKLSLTHVRKRVQKNRRREKGGSAKLSKSCPTLPLTLNPTRPSTFRGSRPASRAKTLRPSLSPNPLPCPTPTSLSRTWGLRAALGPEVFSSNSLPVACPLLIRRLFQRLDMFGFDPRIAVLCFTAVLVHTSGGRFLLAFCFRNLVRMIILGVAGG